MNPPPYKLRELNVFLLAGGHNIWANKRHPGDALYQMWSPSRRKHFGCKALKFGECVFWVPKGIGHPGLNIAGNDP